MLTTQHEGLARPDAAGQGEIGSQITLAAALTHASVFNASRLNGRMSCIRPSRTFTAVSYTHLTLPTTPYV